MAEVKIISYLKFSLQRLKKWIRQNPKEASILVAILLFAAFLRMWKISQYMTFLGDEGRDAIVVRRLLMEGDPILVGPGTSIGNMYLGPLYYYFIAPFLFLANYSPVGPSIGVAIVGVLTVLLIWFVSQAWFSSDKKTGYIAAFVASLLYSVAPTVIIYSRSSWNPNIMPFFSLLTVYSLWSVWKNQNYKWMVILGISYAFVLQSHYLGLLVAPVVVLFWVLSIKKAHKNKSHKMFFIWSIFSAMLFFFLMSPLVIFDARHGWRNLEAIKKFFTERQTTVSARPWNALPNLWPQLNKVTTSLLLAKESQFSQWVSLALLFPLIAVFRVVKKLRLSEKTKDAYFLIFIWLFVGLLGLGVYKQEIYDHYYGFLFPVPFLMLGGVSQILVERSRIRGTSLVAVGVLFLVTVNVINNPFRYPPNNQLPRTQKISENIITLSENRPFNLAVIAERNYDDAYEYFLRTKNASVLDIDPQRYEETVTEQLFVVCEMPKEKCDPTHNAKAEVANFGWSEIINTWDIDGITVFKLIHVK